MDNPILTTAKAAYRHFDVLSAEEKDAVLQVLAEYLPDDDAAEVAEMRLYHLREGDKSQLKLDAILRESRGNGGPQC